jgi:hypothetical protein
MIEPQITQISQITQAQDNKTDRRTSGSKEDRCCHEEIRDRRAHLSCLPLDVLFSPCLICVI